MKTFSQRIKADWKTRAKLEELLDEFFLNEKTYKSLTHLYCWLNISWIEFEARKKDLKFSDLLIAAENACEEWVVSHGFSADRSFARYYLDKYYKKESVSSNPIPQITIVLDK